jgi:hypothetical protein
VLFGGLLLAATWLSRGKGRTHKTHPSVKFDPFAAYESAEYIDAESKRKLYGIGG